MKIITAAVVASSLVAFATSLAFAQTPADPAKAEKREQRAAKMQERFKSADKNNDGKISREEATASMPRLAKHFDEIDTNKDGFITKAEMKAAHDRHAEKKPASK